MGLRRSVVAIGTGITVFLVVAVAVIELLAVEFSALVGLPVGLLAGIGAVAVVLGLAADGPAYRRWLATALAGFGYGILLTLAARYVHLVEAGFETTLAIAALAGVVALVLAILADRPR